MSFDITKKRALESAPIDLVNGDGSPLLDDNGNQLTVTVFGPGSKRWQQADADRNRKRTARIEKNRGRLAAALENAKADEVDFLVSITISFDGWAYPPPEGSPPWATSADMFRACYEDDKLGFIRDHVHATANNWENFTKG